MSSILPPFGGFTRETFEFLADLEKNNNTKWFAENKERYQRYLVLPSKSFVATIGQFFNHLNPAIRTEPKFNKTLMRINKDMRFAKGEPYRNYFLIHFGKFKMDSEFYVYLDKNGIEYGLFLNNSHGDEFYFGTNILKFNQEFRAAFNRFKINGKFDLYELHKEPMLNIKKFNIDQNYDKLTGMKYILLQKRITSDSKLTTSADFLTAAIKTFSNLYPLYCFAISPRPLFLIEEFEERLGIAE